MTPTSLIQSLQSDALAREIDRQIRDERNAVIAAGERAASAIVAQARTAARRQMHDAIAELRREGERRLLRAKAQVETDERERAQALAGEAVRAAWPLLRESLAARWNDPRQRQAWVTALAREAGARLRPGAWVIEHPVYWNANEQKDFLTALAGCAGADVTFKADKTVAVGLRICADQAVLDATPHGLLADQPTITALLLAEIGNGAAP